MTRLLLLLEIALIFMVASNAHAADLPAAKPQQAVPPTPEAVAAIDRDLATFRKTTSPREKITTDIGEVTRLTCWFDTAGALRKIEKAAVCRSPPGVAPRTSFVRCSAAMVN
jgi:hypothetical protein